MRCFGFFKIYFTFNYVCLCADAYEYGCLWRPKVFDPLELELQLVEAIRWVGTGN